MEDVPSDAFPSDIKRAVLVDHPIGSVGVFGPEAQLIGIYFMLWFISHGLQISPPSYRILPLRRMFM